MRNPSPYQCIKIYKGTEAIWNNKTDYLHEFSIFHTKKNHTSQWKPAQKSKLLVKATEQICHEILF